MNLLTKCINTFVTSGDVNVGITGLYATRLKYIVPYNYTGEKLKLHIFNNCLLIQRSA